MKTTAVSSYANSFSMRNVLLRMQSELARGQKEVQTGRSADPGLKLGQATSQTVSFARDIERVNNIIDTNALAKSRLSATQDALGQITELARTMLSTLTSAMSGDANPTVTLTDARSLLDGMTSILNTSINGEHLFAGINTDVQPFDDYTDPSSSGKAAFDAAFLGHFGFAQTDPQADTITQADMATFLDTVVDPQFLGAGWSDFSNASDEVITSRIALNETTKSSVSANEAGIRKLAMAAVTISDLFDSAVGAGGRTALIEKAVSMVGEALADIANLQSATGIVENRVKAASERLTMQSDLYQRFISDMEGVDPYEASTRVSSLLAQIETSYALTARIQQLSLTRFIS